MENKAINSLKYTGIVTLSRYVNNKKIKIAKVHNSGEASLFNFLADCLMGNFETAHLSRPTKIMLLKDDVSVSGWIHLTNPPERVYEAGACKVRYSFTIPREHLVGTKFNGLGLYAYGTPDNRTDEYSAKCSVDLSEEELTVSSVLTVDWELIIANKETEES